ncbi:hypothetical protein LCGC14_0964430 [marine sediment metagenome]|uniref:Uncharacterized protein n=1 Tax=marine sediment metagenome TaxID=412755 RepID=A0A0F9NZL1_9ZZZZ
MDAQARVLRAVSKYLQAETLKKATEFAEQELLQAVREVPSDYMGDYVQRTSELQEAIEAL